MFKHRIFGSYFLMHLIGLFSALLLLGGFFLNWPKEGVSKGYQNPEGFMVLFIAIIVLGLAVYNHIKKKNFLTGLYLPLGAGGLAAIYIFLKIAGKGVSFFDTGLYLIATGSLLIILLGCAALFNQRKQLVVALPGLALVAASVFLGSRIIGEEFADAKTEKADHFVNAISLIKAFEKDNKTANEQYRDKIVSVSGRVSETEAADSVINIKFADTVTGSYIIFAFQQQHLPEAKTLKQGDSVMIKGYCGGGEYSEILESSFITFQRSVIDKKF